jgi:exosortase K
MKTRLCVVVATVLIAWSLKRHYADARADDLWWILAPTSQLVGAITHTTFTMQPGEGYFSRDRLFLIEKSCAGVNFMIAAFGMLMFALFHRVRSGMSGLGVIGASLLASYLAAVLVNAVRIAIAMWLADHPTALSTYSPESVHRVEGIVVYFAGLVLVYELARRLDRDAVDHRFGRIALPLASYYGITLGVPLLNGAAKAGSVFVEHALVVLLVPPVALVLACLIHRVSRVSLRRAAALSRR